MFLGRGGRDGGEKVWREWYKGGLYCWYGGDGCGYLKGRYGDNEDG